MILPIVVSAFSFYLLFPNLFFLQGFSFLAWIFAVPFFLVLEKQNSLGRIRCGFFFGLLSNLLAVNWMIPYSFLGYLLLCLALSSQAIFFAALYPTGRKKRVVQIIYVPCAWVASECLRKMIMFGQSWDLGHCLSFDVPLLQTARVLGSPGISFLIICCNYVLYLGMFRLKHLREKLSAILLVLFLVSIAYGFGFFVIRHENQKIRDVFRICLIQPNIDYHLELSASRVDQIADQLIALSKIALKDSVADLVVWPETAIPTDFWEDVVLKRKIVGLVTEAHVPFLIGAVISDERGTHNSAVLLNKYGDVQKIYDKRHLIPLTEYIPPSWFWKTFARIFHVQSPDLLPGNVMGLMKMHLTTSNKQVCFGVAICSEDNIAEVFRQYKDKGADFVVVLLNNGWFSQKAGLVMHAQHSIVHAAENAMPVLRASNTGLSGLIDVSGLLSKESLGALEQKKFFHYQVVLSQKKMPLINLSDSFNVFCGVFVIISLLWFLTEAHLKKK